MRYFPLLIYDVKIASSIFTRSSPIYGTWCYGVTHPLVVHLYPTLVLAYINRSVVVIITYVLTVGESCYWCSVRNGCALHLYALYPLGSGSVITSAYFHK